MSACKKCNGDGWVEIMDPNFAGAVVGARECPDCGGSGSHIGGVEQAYAAYDSDPRVNGPDDFEAFADAVRSLTREEAS